MAQQVTGVDHPLPERESFTAPELSAVCAQFILGTVDSIQEIRAGDSAAPKALITSSLGRFVLKRRAAGRDNPFRVAFSHEVMLHLDAGGFPLPKLNGTRSENNSMLQHDGNVYELLTYIDARPWSGEPDGAEQVGRAMARMHEQLESLTPTYRPPDEPAPTVDAIRDALARATARDATLADHAERLTEMTDRAESTLVESGFASAPVQVVHGDWHPGNTLFSEGQLQAIVDYDAVRYAPTAADLAQAALLFGTSRVGDTPGEWSDQSDLDQMEAVARGYQRPPGPGARAIPALMGRLLIGESIGQIAATGRFGPHPAGEMLDYVIRRVDWIESNAGQITSRLAV